MKSGKGVLKHTTEETVVSIELLYELQEMTRGADIQKDQQKYSVCELQRTPVFLESTKFPWVLIESQ